MKTKKTLWILKNQNYDQRLYFFDFASPISNAAKNDEIVIGEFLCKISNVIWSPSEQYLRLHQMVDFREHVMDSYTRGNVEIVKAYIVHPVLV